MNEWCTVELDGERQDGYWEAEYVVCFCGGSVLVDPQLDTPGTCHECGRSYRLVIQVKEPAA